MCWPGTVWACFCRQRRDPTSAARQPLPPLRCIPCNHFLRVWLGVVLLCAVHRYDVVCNLGALAARFVFKPLEENFYVFFAKIVPRSNDAAAVGGSGLEAEADRQQRSSSRADDLRVALHTLSTVLWHVVALLSFADACVVKCVRVRLCVCLSVCVFVSAQTIACEVKSKTASANPPRAFRLVTLCLRLPR
jgi:hypothetical protein